MAFPQLTYRESLRDIEVCLAAQAGKLYHMGITEPVARSTLADANESRDWHIYFEFAQRLIVKARALYAGDECSVELTNTLVANSDSTTQQFLPHPGPAAFFLDLSVNDLDVH